MTRLRIKQVQLKRQLVSQKKARLEKIIYNEAQTKRQNKYKESLGDINNRMKRSNIH